MMFGKCRKMCGGLMIVIGLLWLATAKGLVQLPLAGVHWLGVMLVILGAIKVFMHCQECEGHSCCGK